MKYLIKNYIYYISIFFIILIILYLINEPIYIESIALKFYSTSIFLR